MCKINMLGYTVEIDYGKHVRERLESRFDDMDCGYLDYRIEELFCEESVADYLMNEVRVGEDAVLIDEDSGITFALAVGTDLIYIKTVFNAFEPTPFLVRDREPVMRFAKSLGFRAERFERKRRSGEYAEV